MMFSFSIALFFSLGICASAAAQVLAPNAPIDKPVSATSAQQAAFEKAIQPFIKQARATYPEARKRYQNGLSRGKSFFITTRLRDSSGAREQVFIAVQKIEAGVITGKIANEIYSVKGFKRQDIYRFPESEIIDWVISNPDGSEEGNYVGKFLDTYQPK